MFPEPHIRPSSRELRVCIIGGGLGGLSCALALQRAGIRCAVYEKDSSFGVRKQGYGLTLTNNAKGPLAALGLLEKCKEADCASNWHWIFDRAGKILGYYGREFSESLLSREQASWSTGDLGSKSSGSRAAVMGPHDDGKGERGNLRIPRQDLRRMLLNELQDGTVKWGCAIEDYHEKGDCVTVYYRISGCDSGLQKVDVDVLVGADGIHSVVRKLRDAKLWGSSPSRFELSPPLRYTGVSVILGISTIKHALIDRGGFYMYDGQHRLFTMPFRASEKETLTMWQLSFVGLSEEAARALRLDGPDGLRCEALRRTQDCFKPVQELIRGTPKEEIWATGLYDRDPMRALSKDKGTRVTVIGDAAHPMSMFKGQGANQAISDGPRLVKWLIKSTHTKGAKDIETKLRCFEREMVQAAAPKVLASRNAAVNLHHESALTFDYGFAGWKCSEKRNRALEMLDAFGIRASLGEDLVKEVHATLVS